MKPYAYACPAQCGCLWRDNGDTPPVGKTMSLFGPRSQSCAVCEPLPLSKLLPLYVAPWPDTRGLLAEAAVKLEASRTPPIYLLKRINAALERKKPK